MYRHVKVNEIVLLFSCQTTMAFSYSSAGSEDFCPFNLVVDKVACRELPAHFLSPSTPQTHWACVCD